MVAANRGQTVETAFREAGAGGSNPLTSTSFFLSFPAVFEGITPTGAYRTKRVNPATNVSACHHRDTTFRRFVSSYGEDGSSICRTRPYARPRMHPNGHIITRDQQAAPRRRRRAAEMFPHLAPEEMARKRRLACPYRTQVFRR